MSRLPPFRKVIEHLVEKWKVVVGLSGWDIRVLFDERKHLGTNTSMPEYLSTDVRFNLRRIRAEIGRNEEELSKLVIHELVHALTWDKNKKDEELLTTEIERAIWRAYLLGKAERP